MSGQAALRQPGRAAPLQFAVHSLGLVACIAYGAMTLLSYPQAAALWRTETAPRAQAFFDILADKVRAGSPRAAQWLAAGSWPADNVDVLILYCLVLAVPTLASIAMLAALRLRQSDADAATLKALRGWAVAFAVVSLAAYPVFTQDFWLSAVWGRMIAAGDNPYHRIFTDADVGSLPLDHFAMPMSYGPLWGLVSAAVMLIAGNKLIAIAVLFKLVLLAAWLGCLAAICQLNRRLPMVDQCRGVAMFGWLPAGVSQTIAEGHNDIAMVLMLLVWLALLAQRRWQAPLALAASVLCKFASAPLALIEAVEIVRRETTWPRRLARLVLPALFGLAVLAIFYRSPRFFDGLFLINEWHFLQPRDAVAGLGQLLGIWLVPVAIAVTVAFPIHAGYRLWINARDTTLENHLKGAIAIMTAILFAAIAHVWPWYVIWGLGLAALMPSWWLSRLLVGVALLMPFTLVSWWIAPLGDQRDLISLGVYAFAGMWCAGPVLAQWLSRRRTSAARLPAGCATSQNNP